MSDRGSILVTGGAGYNGPHTVRALGALDRDVVVPDSLEVGVADVVIGAPFIVGNISDDALVSAICAAGFAERTLGRRAQHRLDGIVRTPYEWRRRQNR